MGLPKVSFFFVLLFLASALVAAGRHHKLHGTVERMFVFGDSYADTGNLPQTSYPPPYGITFPGKPAGRASDGRISTDFIARMVGIKTPIAYRNFKKGLEQGGVNFAIGGTGVFNTSATSGNMTTEIDNFQKLLNDSVYTQHDLNSALFFVTLSGNDYLHYFSTGGSVLGLPGFIRSVVKQMGVNLQRLHSLGARKIAVGGLPPLGCVPAVTLQTSYKKCSDAVNLNVDFHNLKLNQAVANLNNQSGYTAFTVLDLYATFTTIFHTKKDETGAVRFDMPLTPCCAGISPGYFCGSVDEKGNKMYSLCSDPGSAFFWDVLHPTQAGWRAASAALKPVIQKIIST